MTGRNLIEDDLYRVESEIFKLKKSLSEIKLGIVALVASIVISYGVHAFFELKVAHMSMAAERERAEMNYAVQKEIDENRYATLKRNDDAKRAAELERSVGHCIVSGKSPGFCRSAYGVEMDENN